VSLSNFSHGGQQFNLLEAEKREKLEKLTQATDGLRNRFGFDSVQFGGSLRHEGRNSNEGWGLRQTKRRNQSEAEASLRKKPTGPPDEPGFDLD
jgi:hypothetical protein